MNKSLQIVIGFRDREIQRVKRCLGSLSQQSDLSFSLVLVDYGSESSLSERVKEIAIRYSFCRYVYSNTRGWFWNRSHALNTGVRLTEGAEFVITSDIDLVFPPDFIARMKAELSIERAVHAIANNLPPNFSAWSKLWVSNRQFGIRRANTALGLVQGVSKKVFEHVGGFDEYYQIWGAEDEDLNMRLQQYGVKTHWIDSDKKPIYHQWHPSSGAHSFNIPSRWQEVCSSIRKRTNL